MGEASSARGQAMLKLADALKPLTDSLTDDQKRRLPVLLRGMGRMMAGGGFMRERGPRWRGGAGMYPPEMGAPGMGAPGMGAPGMGGPGMGGPGMGGPGMGGPGMGGPGMGGPGWRGPRWQRQGSRGPLAPSAPADGFCARERFGMVDPDGSGPWIDRSDLGRQLPFGPGQKL